MLESVHTWFHLFQHISLNQINYGNSGDPSFYWIIGCQLKSRPTHHRSNTCTKFSKNCFSLVKTYSFNAVVKQVLAPYINHSRIRFLEPTSICVIWRIMAVIPYRARFQDPWIERHTPYIINHSATALLKS